MNQFPLTVGLLSGLQKQDLPSKDPLLHMYPKSNVALQDGETEDGKSIGVAAVAVDQKDFNPIFVLVN